MATKRDRIAPTTLSRRERVRRGTVASEHLLQLFDTPESLAASVATFIVEGHDKRERVLIVATEPHWSAIREEMAARKVDAEALMASGELVKLDALQLLSRFMRHGEPNRALFQQTVGALVADLAAAPLRIYGEMVEVLASEGNYKGAAHLEDLWNHLSLQHSFTLLCGYSAAHFAGPDAGSSLGIICCQHSRSFCEPHDALSSFLLSRHQQARAFPITR